MAQSLVPTDMRTYFATQSGKGVVPSAFRTYQQLTAFTKNPEKVVIEGVAGLGDGKHAQKAVGESFRITGSLTVRLTTGRALAHLLATDYTLSTDASGAPVYLHTLTPNARNVNDKYTAMAAIYGEQGTPGTGVMATFVRDLKYGNRTLTFGEGAPVEMTTDFSALNEGDGAGGETFAEESTYNLPLAYGSGSTMTGPSWWPSAYCVNRVTVAENAPVTFGPPCFPTGEASDVLKPTDTTTITVEGVFDADTAQMYKHVYYGTATAGSIAATSGLTAALKEGGFNFRLKSLEFITGTTPYYIEGDFPNVQWTNFTMDIAQVPQRFTLTGQVFGRAHTFKEQNDLTNVQMTV